MVKAGVVLVLGIALGVGAVLWQGSAGTDSVSAGAAAPAAGASLVAAAQGKPLAERVAALEAALDRSVGTQLDLFEQLLRLEALLDEQLGDQTGVPEEAGVAAVATLRDRNGEARQQRVDRPASAAERRRERLVSYGFDEETAARITEREGELRMDMMRQRYERRYAAIEGREPPPANPLGNYHDQLREELGDDQYDRYLYASGRSNRVRVNGVIATSPAEQAGLQRGDVILSYDGQRVFRMNDIIRLSHQGQKGETISLEIERADGGRDTLYLPRGPLGMWGGGRKRVDPNE
ncbi:PDZ domain-containing protein [Exilibacterium tricleocarpae]|uniref:PDZ domain-containing protein n=1 Tax=Exilibacterium tricleocarpae TaxID=2591008 RepID=A0A545SSR2_9GAMM|nr:PDZ domain-containing protein [Exilibacterium tricleocarpae]TQV67975.1 PDZ domain-containing protein [Exilibacterium tricleocarpae]